MFVVNLRPDVVVRAVDDNILVALVVREAAISDCWSAAVKKAAEAV